MTRWFQHRAVFHGRDEALRYAHQRANRTGLRMRVYLDSSLMCWIVAPA